MKLLRIILIITLIIGLIGVRMTEDVLFYDPFLGYFKSADENAEMPNYEWSKLMGGYLFRFLLNLSISVGLIQLIFRNKKWTIQAGVLILLVFGFTFPLYLYCIYTEFEVGYLFSFYMRRFVIQPLTLLLIIPLFYYRKAVLIDRD